MILTSAPNILRNLDYDPASSPRVLRSCGEQNVIWRLENQIIQTSALLDSSTVLRDDIRDYPHAHQLVPTAIHRLPVEILQEIFVHCLPKDQYVRPSPYQAPLLLGQVCLHWRHAALSTPRLWSSFAIQLSQTNSPQRIYLMETWLKRSGGFPISLFAYIPAAGDGPVDSFLRIFSTYLHRWRNLRLTLPYRCCSMLLTSLNSRLPMLETLQIRFSPIHDSEDLSPQPRLKFVASSQSAPRLSSLLWSSPGFYPAGLSLQMSEILRLDVDCRLSMHECMEIMRHCPKLVECEFRALTGSENTTFPSAHFDSTGFITLPQLRSLSLHAYITDAFSYLFQRMSLPALTMLKLVDITLEPDIGAWIQPAFNSFIARSSCALHTLQLLNVLSSEGELIQCLHCTSQSLVDLRLLDLKGIPIVMDNVLELLTVRETEEGMYECLCPHLEVMKLGSSLASSDGVLAAMVESRWGSTFTEHRRKSRGHIAPLRSINPRLDFREHPEDIRRLNALRQKGLELL